MCLELTSDESFHKKFSFCTLVTRPEEYAEMVSSAKLAGFDGNDVEFFYFNNKNNNHFDGYTGLNRAMRSVNGKYLIFCHQDVLFNHDKREKLEQCILEVETVDQRWAVIGNAGKMKSGRQVIRITDPALSNCKIGDFPSQVESVDENFIIVNRSVNVACTYGLTGFHFYGADICQNAIYNGLNCYVIDFHLLHKSGGKVDQAYDICINNYRRMAFKRKRAQVVKTLIKDVFVSSSGILNFIMNHRRLLRLSRSIAKRCEMINTIISK